MSYHDTLNSFGADQVKSWLHDRLHGCDALCPPPDPRDDERTYVRASDLYASSEMGDQFKLHLRSAVHDAIASAAEQYPEGAWKSPVALDSLMRLAVDVCEGLRRSGMRDSIAQSIRQLIAPDKLPFEQDKVRLKQLAARALLDLRMPPPQPESFWKGLWQQAVEAKRYIFAGIVFEGLYSQVNLETACEWLGTATPWQPEIMPQVLGNRLRSIIADSNAQRVTEVLESCLFPRIISLENRSRVWNECARYGIEPMLPLEADAFVLDFFASHIVGGPTRKIWQDNQQIELAPSAQVRCLQSLPNLLSENRDKLGDIDAIRNEKKAFYVADALVNEFQCISPKSTFWDEFSSLANWETVGELVKKQTNKIVFFGTGLEYHTSSISRAVGV
jgi:hypothetical protein